MNTFTKSVGRSAFLFSLGTLLSRFSGMAREMVMAFVLGTTPAAAAFLVAFRFSYLLRRILGEGALVNGFVPRYEAIRLSSIQEASAFFRDLLATLAFLLLGIISLSEIALMATIHYIPLSPNNREILSLIMLSLPGLFFICLFAIKSGFLQCHGRFFLTGVAPMVFNLAWIGTLFWQRHSPPSEAAASLATALSLAFFLQWAVLLPPSLRHLKGTLSKKQWLQIQLFSPPIRKMAAALLLSIIGVSATQINGFIDMLFARAASLEGPAYLAYASRLYQLPLALFGLAIASALFPPLARAVQGNQKAEASLFIHTSLMRSCSILLPITIGIFILAGPAVNLLFGRGGFDEISTYYTSRCLFFYGIGLLPATLSIILSQVFYAHGDYRTPMIAALFSMVANIATSSLLVFGYHLGAESIALSNSFSALLNALFLYTQRRGLSFFYDKIGTLTKLTTCALGAGVCALAVDWSYLKGNILALFLQQPTLLDWPRNLSLQWFEFSLPALVFGGTFLVLCWVCKLKEVLSLFRIERKQQTVETSK